MLDFRAPPPATVQGDPGNTVRVRNRLREGMSEDVKRAIMENQAKEQAKIDAKRTEHLQALQEQEKEQEERRRCPDLKAKLLAWSGDEKSGTLKNIRTLLSTLENILREEA